MNPVRFVRLTKIIVQPREDYYFVIISFQIQNVDGKVLKLNALGCKAIVCLDTHTHTL